MRHHFKKALGLSLFLTLNAPCLAGDMDEPWGDGLNLGLPVCIDIDDPVFEVMTRLLKDEERLRLEHLTPDLEVIFDEFGHKEFQTFATWAVPCLVQHSSPEFQSLLLGVFKSIYHTKLKGV